MFSPTKQRQHTHKTQGSLHCEKCSMQTLGVQTQHAQICSASQADRATGASSPTPTEESIPNGNVRRDVLYLIYSLLLYSNVWNQNQDQHNGGTFWKCSCYVEFIVPKSACFCTIKHNVLIHPTRARLLVIWMQLITLLVIHPLCLFFREMPWKSNQLTVWTETPDVIHRHHSVLFYCLMRCTHF